MQGNVTPLEDRPCTDREIKLAGVAAVEPALARRDVLFGLTGRTGNALRPNAGFQKEPSRFRSRKHLEKLEGRYCAFAHGLTVLYSRTVVKGVNYIVPQLLVLKRCALGVNDYCGRMAWEDWRTSQFGNGVAREPHSSQNQA